MTKKFHFFNKTHQELQNCVFNFFILIFIDKAGKKFPIPFFVVIGPF